jgi:hypothetical protein
MQCPYENNSPLSQKCKEDLNPYQSILAMVKKSNIQNLNPRKKLKYSCEHPENKWTKVENPTQTNAILFAVTAAT